MDRPLTIEQGSNRFGRAVRENRLKLALILGLAEGVLVLVGKIPLWVVILVAVGAVALYVTRGRQARREEIREGTWVLAVSQLAVVLVPVFALVLTAFALFVLVVFAMVALVILLRDRR